MATRLTLMTALLAVTVHAHGQVPLVNRLSGQGIAFRVGSVDVNADIVDQVATVQMAQVFRNVSHRTLETQFLFPLPEGAAINGLTLVVDGKELPGELKPKEQARREYEAIVRKQQDPALLEYVGQRLFRTSVFPVPAGQERRVEIRYTQVLQKDFGLVDFILPLGTMKHTRQPIDKVDITIRVTSKSELKNLYSPTHDFDITRSEDTRAVCRLSLKNVTDPDDTRLLYGIQGGEFGMHLVSYRPDGDDEDEHGYFMLLASPHVAAERRQTIPKTILFVVDRSGSMSGEKIRQAKSSLRLMINQLGPKDTFNIVSYASEVDLFQPELELVSDKTRQAALIYVEDIYAGGGTNINEALTSALNQLQTLDRPNYVLFFTDGLPSVGETDETAIAVNVDQANNAGARVFSFGVGYDVNSRLLDRLSTEQRGTSVYVKPEEDIEVAASNLFLKVSEPAMTNMKLNFSASGNDQAGRLVTRTYPRELPDMFHGEQLIVVGRYRTSTAANVTLTGQVAGKSREMNLEARFGDSNETRSNRFVETLWATRRIGELIDELDLKGRNSELIDELVSLSLKHGIMTPYTSFLADENQSFRDREQLSAETLSRSDGLSVASGRGGFAQRRFKSRLRQAQRANSYGAREATQEVDPIRQKAAHRFGGIGGRRSMAIKRRQLQFDSGDEDFGHLPADVAGQLVRRSTGSGAAAVGGDESDLDGKHTVSRRVRRIGTKTFYWKNNEWQDSEYGTLKEADAKEVIEVQQFSDEYFKLTQLNDGRYSKYLTRTEPLLVRIDGRNYRIVPPQKP